MWEIFGHNDKQCTRVKKVWRPQTTNQDQSVDSVPIEVKAQEVANEKSTSADPTDIEQAADSALLVPTEFNEHLDTQNLAQNQSDPTQVPSSEYIGANLTPRAQVMKDKISSASSKNGQNYFSVLANVLQDIENIPPRSRKPTQKALENMKQAMKKTGGPGMPSSSFKSL